MPVNPIDVDSAIDAAVDRALTGKPILPKNLSGPRKPPTVADCKRLSRALGMPMEEFNRQLGEKLAIISDKIAGRIEEKIDEDAFKPGELGFIFSVTEDKRRALDSGARLSSAQVNIQVNNYGDKSRDEIIAALLPQQPKVDLIPLDPVASPEPEPDPDNLKPEDVI
jgi:hypothetical protein